MSSAIFAPVAQAAAFAVGCYALHTARVYAARITPYLVLAAAVLVLLVLALITPEEASRSQPLALDVGAEYLM